jgi:signal transduction histidine kinase
MSETGARRTFLLAVGVAVVLAVDVVVLVLSWDSSHWSPLTLVLVMAIAIAIGELSPINVRGVQTSTTGYLLVIPMTLLGPAPSTAISLLMVAVDTARRRPLPLDALSNAAIYASISLACSLAVEALASAGTLSSSGALAVFALILGITTDVISFCLVALWQRVTGRGSILATLRGAFGPIAAFHVVLATLVAGATYVYVEVGLGALLAVLVVIRVSEVLLQTVAQSDARAAEVQSLAAQRTLFLTQSLVAEEHERERLASHLHDEALQLLAVARQEIEEAVEGDPDALGRARSHVQDAIDEMRRTLTHFHPVAIAADGLGPALQVLARQLCRRADVEVDVPADLRVSDPALVYTVARELLANVAKHAEARNVRVSAEASGAELVLDVTDDGVGFSPGRIPNTGHVGLLLTEHRVSAAGGRLTMRSAPGEGTTVEVVLPR